MKRFIIGVILFCSGVCSAEKGVSLITIDGGINPGTTDYILKSIAKATDRGDEVLIIKLSTPGGLLTSTRTIVQGMFASKVPVVVWVAPGGAHAGSAGALITLAAHIAAMAPGTNIGAAHPVSGQGKDIEEHMEEKVTNDAAAFAESIAGTRGRNKKWAISTVRQSVSITADRAKEIGVIDVLAETLDELLAKIDGKKVKLPDGEKILQTKNVTINAIGMNLKQKIIHLLGDPNVLYILMMIAALGIYFELAHPGAVVPGVLGAISLILAFISAQTLPINYGGILLILLGIALLVAEIFVTSFGILGIGGIVSFILGSVFLIDTDLTTKGVSWYVIIPSVIAVSSFLLIVSFLIFRSQKGRVRMGEKSLLGGVGKVIISVSPNHPGKISIRGEVWTAESDEEIDVGVDVIIRSIEGLIVNVRKK